MARTRSQPQEDEVPDRPAGRIITFYSYKGGTGRSMAVANVAWILAMAGQRVLVIDWDFEAPGLHRYYWPFLSDREMTETPGLIDFFVHFVEAAHLQTRRFKENDPGDGAWFHNYADLTCYSTRLDYEFPRDGVIDFVGAGQQGPTYGVRVNTFQWGAFYKDLGGGVFLESVKAGLREDYDFILVDSRTGISDTSGICTVQMPDELVVCFTLNRQSISGAAATATSADAQRRRADGTQSLRIWPVPTRVELNEKDRLEAARLSARENFAPFLWHIPASQRAEYWGNVEVLYFPFYAYEEVLATIADAAQGSNSLLSSMEKLTGYLTADTRQPIMRMPALGRTERTQLLIRYQRAAPLPPNYKQRSPRFYISYAKADNSLPVARKLAGQISSRFGPDAVFWDEKVPFGAKWSVALEQELKKADKFIVIAGPRWKYALGAQDEFKLALDMDKQIIPVFMEGAATRSNVPPVLLERRGFELSGESLDEEIQSFVRQLPEPGPDESSPDTSLPIDIDDPQKGQWGGESKRNGRRLSARVTSGATGDTWFNVELIVERITAAPFEGEVEFHLHPSFHPSVVRVPVKNNRAVLAHRAWGAFTVGASADNGVTRLELDLATLSDAPELFRQR